MTKYLTSRLFIVFFIKFITDWAFNIDSQFMQFLEVDLTENVFLKAISWLLTLIIIGFGLIFINLFFTLIQLTDQMSYSELFQKIANNGIKKCIKLFFENFFVLLSTNFGNEVHLERYPSIFLIIFFIFLPFINGNPLLNNYYGIYKEYEVESSEGTANSESPNYIIHKSQKHEISNRVKNLEQGYTEDEPYFEVEKRGYLFIQAGLIDGFKTHYQEYKGLGSYIECLFISALEKLINSIIYFFIPFVILISVCHYRNRHLT